MLLLRVFCIKFIFLKEIENLIQKLMKGRKINGFKYFIFIQCVQYLFSLAFAKIFGQIPIFHC